PFRGSPRQGGRGRSSLAGRRKPHGTGSEFRVTDGESSRGPGGHPAVEPVCTRLAPARAADHSPRPPSRAQLRGRLRILHGLSGGRFFCSFPLGDDVFSRPLMPTIPLEDSFTDILAKTQRGRRLTDEQLAALAGVGPD